MDKVQKIREEVVRMHSLLPVMDGDNISVNYADRICTTLEMYIDFLQKEPKAKFKVGDSVLYLNEEYVIIDNKKHYTLRSTKERTSVPVVHIDFGNEDYELCLVEKSKKCMYSKDHYTNEDRKALCDGCKEECKFNNKEEPASEEQVKELAGNQHVNETCKENGDSLTQEPVSIDFEQELYKAFGQVKDFTLSMRIAKWFYDMGKNSQEPVSEELEKEIDSYFAKWLQGSSDEGCFNPDSQLVSIYDCHRIARHFANWQKQKNKSKVLTEEQCRKIRDDAFELGKDAMKQKLMAKAVDVTVHIDAGGYPYIPQMELYNYEKDIPLAKEGDKYKVILIKEDLL